MSKEERIFGVGVDIVENSRIKNTLESWGTAFKKKIFTIQEQAYCDRKKESFVHYGVRFAAKEAFLKALGDLRPDSMRWVDLEICQENSGKPVFRFHLNNIGIEITDIKLSLSHTKLHSVAVVLVLVKG